MISNLNKFFFAFIIVSFALPCWSYKVKSIANKKVLIDLEGEKLFVGDQVISADRGADGAPEILGSAKVLQLRPATNPTEAVAVIQDGKFVVGKKVARKAADPTAEPPPPPQKMDSEYVEDEDVYETDEQRRARRSKAIEEDHIILRRDMVKVALVVGFTQDKISTKQAYEAPPFVLEENVTMTGNSTAFGLTVDYPNQWGFVFRGLLLSEKLSVSGLAANNSCNEKTSTDCHANITYLTLGGLARFDYEVDRITWWAGAGGAFKLPTARETTSLRQADLTLTNSLIVSAGFDFALNKRFYLPVSFEYHYSLNTSDTVPTIDHNAVYVGLGKRF